MARLDGIREKRHQPFYDSLITGIGKSSISNLTTLFGNANVGSKNKTNLQIAGQLASQQTYVVKVLRAVMLFKALIDVNAFGAQGTLSALDTSATSTAARALALYELMAYGCYFNFSLGDKVMFSAPCWYAPAGGGPAGASSGNDAQVVTNGVASHQSILKLGKDIHIPVGQNIGVTIEFFPFVKLGEGHTAAYAADLSPLDNLNNFDGLKHVQFYIDGVHTRDVQ